MLRESRGAGQDGGQWLLTGASGLVGQAIARRWSRSEGVRGLYLSRQARARGWIKADLMDRDSLEVVPWSEVSRAVHCASALPDCDGDLMLLNTASTQNFLDGLEGSPVAHVVLISSISVYDVAPGTERAVLSESFASASPEPVYGASKWRQERLVEGWCRARAVPWTILRLSAVYGPGQRPWSALPIFWDLARRGARLTVTAPKTYRQNYVAADDVAEVVWQVLMHGHEGIFNVFSDETVDMWTLAQKVCLAAGGGDVVDERTDAACPELVFDRQRLDAAMSHRFMTLAQGLERLR